MHAGAVSAAVNLFAGAYAVADDPALAMVAGGRHVMDGTFEAVIRGASSTTQYFERMSVVVAADLADCHAGFLRELLPAGCARVRTAVSNGFPGQDAGRLLLVRTSL
jgi:hypothetical protein